MAEPNEHPQIVFKEFKVGETVEYAAQSDLLILKGAVEHLLVAYQGLAEEVQQLRDNEDDRFAVLVTLLLQLVEEGIISGDDLARRFPRIQAAFDQHKAEFDDLEETGEDESDEDIDNG